MSSASKDKGEKKGSRKERDKADYSVLRPPIELGIPGVQQIVNCMTIATTEVKELLLNECDVILECKVCRNLFRALPNFMAHKRVYCRDVYRYVRSMYPTPQLMEEKMVVVVEPEAPPEKPGSVCKDNTKATEPPVLHLNNNPKPPSVTAHMEGKSKPTKLSQNAIPNSEDRKQNRSKQTQVTLTAIEGNKNAVFQTVNNNNDEDSDEEGSHDSESLVSSKSTKSRLTDVDSNSSCLGNTKADVDNTCVVNPKAADGYVRMSLRQRGKKDQDEMSEASEKSEQSVKRKRENKKEDNIQGNHKTKQEDGAPLRKSRRLHDEPLSVSVSLPTVGKDNEDISDNAEKESPQDSESAPSPPALRIVRQRDNVSLKEQLRKLSGCDVKNMKCIKCAMQFSSAKALHTHMMSSHSDKQVFYPCIYCSSMFAQLWGVTRHIQRTHRKTKEHAEKLTETLKKRQVYKSISEVGEYHSPCKVREAAPHKHITVPTRSAKSHSRADCSVVLTQSKVTTKKTPAITQGSFPEPPAVTRNNDAVKAVLNLFECDNCKKMFGRKNIFDRHKQQCIVKKDIVKKDAAEIQQPAVLKLFKCSRCEKGFNIKESLDRHSELCNASKKPQEDKLAATTTELDPFQCAQCDKRFSRKENLDRHMELCNAPKLRVKTASQVQSNPSANRPRRFIRIKRHDDGEVYTRPRSNSSESKTNDNSSLKSDADVIKAKELKNKRVERERLTAGALAGFSEQDLCQIDAMVDMDTLVCLRCKRQYGSISNLRRHAVRHLGWKRFKCRLCRFTSYNKSECRSHLRKIHSNRIHRENDILKFIIDLEAESEPGFTFDSTDRVAPGVNVMNIHDSQSNSCTISTRSNPRASETNSAANVDRMQVLSTRSGVYLKKATPKADDDVDQDIDNDEQDEPTLKTEAKSQVRADRGNVFENVEFMMKHDTSKPVSSVDEFKSSGVDDVTSTETMNFETEMLGRNKDAIPSCAELSTELTHENPGFHNVSESVEATPSVENQGECKFPDKSRVEFMENAIEVDAHKPNVDNRTEYIEDANELEVLDTNYPLSKAEPSEMVVTGDKLVSADVTSVIQETDQCLTSVTESPQLITDVPSMSVIDSTEDENKSGAVDEDFSVAKIALLSSQVETVDGQESVVIHLDPSVEASDQNVCYTHTARIVYPDMPDNFMDTEPDQVEVSENAESTIPVLQPNETSIENFCDNDVSLLKSNDPCVPDLGNSEEVSSSHSNDRTTFTNDVVIDNSCEGNTVAVGGSTESEAVGNDLMSMVEQDIEQFT